MEPTQPAQPVYTIGTVITAIEVAVVSVLTVVVLGVGLDENAPLAIALTGAGSAITLAVGNVIGYRMTHAQVTPVATPNLPLNTIVNLTDPNTPDAVVVPVSVSPAAAYQHPVASGGNP